MGKKIKKKMDAQRERFVSGAVERGIAKATADAIFERLRQIRRIRLQQVAFWLALRLHHLPVTAWFKANHPAEFLAASMTLDKGNTDKLAEFAPEKRTAPRHQGRGAVGQ